MYQQVRHLLIKTRNVPGLAGPSSYHSKEELRVSAGLLLRVFIMVHGSGDGFYAHLFSASPLLEKAPANLLL